MVNYDAYATTFSNSRRNLHWGELDAIIGDMRQCGYTSVLDIGCGNGRLVEQLRVKSEEGRIDNKSKLGVRGEGTVGTKMITDKKEEQSEEEGVGLPLETFGTFGYKSTENSVGKTEHGFSPTRGVLTIVPQNDRNDRNTGFLPESILREGGVQEGQEQGKKDIAYLGLDSSTGMITEARNLHPDYQFEVCPMESLSSHPTIQPSYYDAIVFLASFHHLETREERVQVLRDIRKYLAPGGAIYMTNWNLRDQPRYQKSHRGDGDYDIKIGEYSRYYHGFTVEELGELFHETEYQIIENRVFEGGRNIWSKIQIA